MLVPTGLADFDSEYFHVFAPMQIYPINIPLELTIFVHTIIFNVIGSHPSESSGYHANWYLYGT
jgi:hypothetical protein